ncbi:FAD-dependent pyridine nucleotide-disulfide oxidoreductase [Penicillium capsulatum]|uniref:FAD-dependent pyridine nucleotide-disulfide oxidoreductase n=1 Tax=Penicillium capsulatum TaxID=69766 RepID=A0A9W9I0A4_9EURO|nr:FAD-dependent pyridine nucleotide-disulfide oxidoreductase [Penicillium capsulatum]KAJ6116753.1 FAD-dependent pyridine nucleotide-disulfide oxidoreductase [Penicillium capsulatum]
MRPKKVAIIGAGPSGLVTAKTLLRNFSRGTFSPVIFERRHEVGGLWPTSPSGPAERANAPTLDPSMRTNLSRFTVAFSDLSWESALGPVDIPMFPQARQVGQYLAAYAERYIPPDALRLGHRVTRTIRTVNTDSSIRWKVEWSSSDSGANTRHSEDFDYLVVASGYFACPCLPEIPGLDKFDGQVLHSSVLHKERDRLISKQDGAEGSIAVIGGSMSGVEAASAAALGISSSVSTHSITANGRRNTVHHVYSRPFWALPTYLPHETSDETISFLPLDLTMYDLGRRPPGPIDYALGPIPEEKVKKTNNYFHTLLGTDYEQIGHMHPPSTQQHASRPPWVAIGNDYAEFIRSGAIEATMGRVISVCPVPNSGLGSITVKTGDGESKTLDGITAIVMATGFTPFDSLSFLPADVLQGLEYTTDDAFLPLVLDKGGALRSEIPDLGFVGFYRGPYWGVMEMQARFLGEQWAGHQVQPIQTADQRESVRILRHPGTSTRRGQFPMGDYVGLMESFAKDLDTEKWNISGDLRSGPVIPARYVHRKSALSGQDHARAHAEVRRTLDALDVTSKCDHDAARAGAALAIFRALHGTWKFTHITADQEGWSGTTTFHPRYPTSPAYDREYVCVEYPDNIDEPMSQIKWSVLRLSEAGTDERKSRIEAWSTEAEVGAAQELMHSLQLTPFFRKKEGDEYLSGQSVIFANAVCPDSAEGSSRRDRRYIFHFDGVSISSWECVECEGPESKTREPKTRSRTVYKR